MWKRRVAVLAVASESVRARVEHGAAVEWAAEAAWDGLDDLRDVIAQLAGEPAFASRRDRVRVELDRALVQRRTLVDLPPVRGAELPRLVAQQAGRFFRRRGTSLVVDAVREGRGTEGPVYAAAADEPLLEAIAAVLGVAGLEPDEIAFAGDEHGLSLMPTALRVGSRRRRMASVARLGAVVVGVWLAVGVVYVTDLARDRAAIASELAALRAPLEAMAETRRNLEAAAAVVERVEAGRRVRGRTERLLAAIAEALPDSAYVTALTVRGKTGRVTGVAVDAARVVTSLEHRPEISAPQLVGAIAPAPVHGVSGQRFTIAFGERGAR